MNKIKGAIISLIIIIAIIIIPTKLITDSIKWIGDAIKWVAFIDNAETGLPLLAEAIIKALCEAVVFAFAVSFGISKKNPLIIALSIIAGFIVCIALYAICKYIIVILIVLLSLLILYIALSILLNKKKELINDEKIGG